MLQVSDEKTSFHASHNKRPNFETDPMLQVGEEKVSS